MSTKDDYLDKYCNKSLEDMHNDAYKTIDKEDNYNYDEIHWKPVARDLEFEKQITKLKAMKAFNKGK